MLKVYVDEIDRQYTCNRAWTFTDGQMVETIPSDEEMLDLISDWCIEEPEVQ